MHQEFDDIGVIGERLRKNNNNVFLQ